MPASEEAGRAGVRWSGEITLGAILQAIVVAAGVVAFIVAGADRTKETATNLVTYRGELAKQISDLGTNMNQQLDAIRSDLRSVPSHLDSLDKTQAGQDAAIAGLAVRVQQLERNETEMHTLLNSLGEQLNAPIPLRRR